MKGCHLALLESIKKIKGAVSLYLPINSGSMKWKGNPSLRFLCWDRNMHQLSCQWWIFNSALWTFIDIKCQKSKIHITNFWTCDEKSFALSLLLTVKQKKERKIENTIKHIMRSLQNLEQIVWACFAKLYGNRLCRQPTWENRIIDLA